MILVDTVSLIGVVLVIPQFSSVSHNVEGMVLAGTMISALDLSVFSVFRQIGALQNLLLFDNERANFIKHLEESAISQKI